MNDLTTTTTTTKENSNMSISFHATPEAAEEHAAESARSTGRVLYVRGMRAQAVKAGSAKYVVAPSGMFVGCSLVAKVRPSGSVEHTDRHGYLVQA